MKKYIFLFALFNSVIFWGQSEDYKTTLGALTEKMWEHYYYHQDSAYFYIDKINKLANENGDVENQIQALLHSSGVASYNYDLKRSNNDIVLLERFLNDSVYKKSPEYNTNKNMLLYYKGGYYLKLYAYKKSRETFESIIDNVNRVPDSLMNSTLRELSSVALSFIGKIYLEEDKYDLAKQFYNRDIRTILESKTEEKEALYDNYNLLAEVYKEEKKYQEANAYLLKTYDYNKKENNANSVITTAFNISQNYNHLAQKDSALYYLAEAKSNAKNSQVFVSKYHIIKSEIYAKNKEFEFALSELKIAIDKTNKTLAHKSLDISIAQNKMGELYALQGQHEKAIDKYNLGLAELTKIENKEAFSIKILKNKSISLNAISNNESYIAALRTVDLGVAKLDSLKPSFKSHTDKLVLIEDAFPLFESGLEASYSLNASIKNDSLIDQAFRYTEKCKSVLLLEALLSTKATAYANIPKELIEKESQLKSEITYVEKLIKNSKEESFELRNQLFELKNGHRKLVQNIETNYPSYFNLKYNTEVISTSEIQKFLNEDEMVLSYFYGNKTIYMISITKANKQIHKFPVDTILEEEIRAVHEMLGNPKSEVAILAKKSFNIYEKLVKPILTENLKRRLIIIPDGLLNYIPFGSLNTEENGIRYLIEDVSLTYANSATLWSQLRGRKNENSNVLAFAPSFENTSGNTDETSKKLLPLPHNTREATQILNSFKGNSFINTEASLSNFNAQIHKYGILHLATHAIFDDASPEYSYLAFTPKKNEEYLLYVQDLYNLNLKADMVTLSACESGIGELKRGEGFLSLARGFFYSGAASITSTLWKINDASATKIMNSFYKNLSFGNQKGIALQKAKKTFLESNRQNALSHPYYWSGFIVSGNTMPLTSPTNWTWIILSISVLVIVFIFLFRKKKQSLVQSFQ